MAEQRLRLQPTAVRSLVKDWLDDTKQPQGSKRERPNYFYARPDVLVAEASPSHFFTGTGEDVLTRILPQLEMVESELVIVTCFWAPSPTRDRLCESLRNISRRAVQSRTKIKVFIGLSSVSLLQKLSHTSSVAGHTYSTSELSRKLGLPPAKELQGLKLTVKSVFVRPFSVMHPKFIILDRRKVWLPSCNVSWEKWFEGCVELSGSIVANFVEFWESFWTSGTGTVASGLESPPENGSVLSLFLPSPHHVNPRFRPFFWQAAPPSPRTPLNTFLLRLLSSAQSSVYLQSPNITSPPVLAALVDALTRGVDIHILTSARLMILEQLVTAGTTTSRCIKYLIRRHKRMLANQRSEDEEAVLGPVGGLRVEYYRPVPDAGKNEPVQSHLKATIVDGYIVVLGSGNMDRASWYTSQELDVAFFDEKFAKSCRSSIDAAMLNSRSLYYESEGSQE